MKIHIKALCLFLTIVVLLGSFILNRYHTLSTQHLEMRDEIFHSCFSSISHTFRLVSQTIVNEILRRDDVLELVHAIVTSDNDQQRNHLRGLLYQKLNPMYQRVSQHSVRQFHFHFPDNRSMLRFHRPTKADDDLTASRPSVVTANQQHQEVHGYESGRIIHGFRHVYPLEYKGTAVGSVEVSNSFQQFRHELIKYSTQSKADYLFIMLKEDLWQKLAPGQQELYAPSVLDPNYLCENSASSYYEFCGGTAAVSPTLQQIQQRLSKHPKLAAMLQTREDFILTTTSDKQLYAALFHSIKNIDGIHAAYIISIHPENTLMELRASAIVQCAIAVLFALIVVVYRLKLAKNREEKQAISDFLHSVSTNMGEGLYTTDIHGSVTFMNPEATRLLGYTGDEILDKNAHALFHAQDENYNHHGCVILSTIMNNHTYQQVETTFIHKNQQPVAVELTCTPMKKQGKVTGSITLFRDISQRREQEQQLQAAQESLRLANLDLKKQANIDGLTGIANRRLFDHMLKKMWQVAYRHKQPLAVLMIDIDYFKLYNDHYGHVQGDACLKQVATLIQQSCLRPDDFVARYGGEEFIALLPNTAVNDAKGVAERMRTNVYQAQISHAKSHSSAVVTMSIGVCSMQPDDHTTAQHLIDCADQRLYRAKNDGRNQICWQTVD